MDWKEALITISAQVQNNISIIQCSP